MDGVNRGWTSFCEDWGLRWSWWMSWLYVECGFGHWSSFAPHSQRLGADSTLVIWYLTWNLIFTSKCHKCHSLIFQIRFILWVPILIAQWYPIDLSIPYLASVHHDYEVSRFITVPLTTLSFSDNFGFIGYVCLRWVIELLEGGVEVGIDLRVSVMSSMGMVLV